MTEEELIAEVKADIGLWVQRREESAEEWAQRVAVSALYRCRDGGLMMDACGRVIATLVLDLLPAMIMRERADGTRSLYGIIGGTDPIVAAMPDSFFTARRHTPGEPGSFTAAQEIDATEDTGGSDTVLTVGDRAFYGDQQRCEAETEDYGRCVCPSGHDGFHFTSKGRWSNRAAAHVERDAAADRAARWIWENDQRWRSFNRDLNAVAFDSLADPIQEDLRDYAQSIFDLLPTPEAT